MTDVTETAIWGDCMVGSVHQADVPLGCRNPSVSDNQGDNKQMSSETTSYNCLCQSPITMATLHHLNHLSYMIGRGGM